MNFQEVKNISDIPKNKYLIYALSIDGKYIVLGRGKYNRAKVLKKDWDYDFWQITSNKSNHVFEWLREDQNNNISILNFWQGGDLSDIRKNISEDTAIDVVMESNWMPELNKFLENVDKAITKDIARRSKGIGSVTNATK